MQAQPAALPAQTAARPFLFLDCGSAISVSGIRFGANRRMHAWDVLSLLTRVVGKMFVHRLFKRIRCMFINALNAVH
jgi:hypothetical protein